MGLDSYFMSRLTDKYQAYDHYKGISFDEASYTSTPTRTGSRLLSGNSVSMSNGTFTADGNNTATLETGVMPNQKYYQFEFDNTVSPTKNARLIFGSTSSSNVGGLNDVRRVLWDYTPFDRVCGVWIKMPSSIATNGNVLAGVRFLGNGTSAMINIAAAKSTNGLPAITIIHSTAELSSTGPITPYYESYTDQNNNVINIEWDKWYFVAVQKSVNESNTPSVGNPATGTLEYKHYINGELVGTYTASSWTKRSINAIVFGNNTVVTNGKIGISGWFLTDTSIVGQTELREIYKYGAPIQAPVKYYDGTTWQDDISAPKIFHSNKWNDVYANKYDGSQWVPI
jgi:hypothetical protein